MMYDAWDSLERDEVSKLNKVAKQNNWTRLRGSSWVSVQGGVSTLISYETVICDYDPTNNRIVFNYRAFEFSNTTCRHISLFLDRYTNGVNYQECKKCINDMIVGEVREMSNGTEIMCA